VNVPVALRALVHDDGGDVLAEYALILAILSMASVSVLSFFGAYATSAMNQTTSTQLQYELTPPG
jgi:Flp pilus assembly pilin Flp